MCPHVSDLRAFEPQLVQKPVVITTGRGCASPFGLKLKSRTVGLRAHSKTSVALDFAGRKMILQKTCQYRIFNSLALAPVDGCRVNRG